MIHKRANLTIEEFVAGVLACDRANLARAITLIESTRADHAERAQELLQRLLPHAGRAMRVGLTGVPGVGKSTVIDQLGLDLIGRGHRIAVLAVDPTSKRTGGAILGDKTRMHRLAQRPEAFIRPSPTSGTLGGVARRTRECMTLLEAAGFDVVIVETVGVGQSETAVADMVDVFVVLALAGSGDELQGIKRGVIEIADIVAVTKADGDNIERAGRAAGELQSALNIINPPSQHWQAHVLTLSAQHNVGLDALWESILEHRQRMMASGEFEARRRRQRVAWMRELLLDEVKSLVLGQGRVARRVRTLEKLVAESSLTPVLAVAEILSLVSRGMGGGKAR